MLTTKYGNHCYVYINATRYHYTSGLQTLQNDCDEIVVFSKGHRGIPSPGHISLLDHYKVGVIDDQHIYTHTSYAKNIVTFIWHCETTEYYPPPVGVQSGMPYCWTHDDDMDKYVTYGNHIYLGWKNQSPQFETGINAQYEFADVAFWFWYYMCDGDNVISALNHMASTIWGVPYFTDTELVY